MSVTRDFSNTRLVMEENERRGRVLAEANDTRQAPLTAMYSASSDRDDCQPSPGSVMTILQSLEKRHLPNHLSVGSGDYVDSSNAPTLPLPKTKLKSFQESRFPLYSSLANSRTSSSVGTSTEEDQLLSHSFNKTRTVTDGPNESPNDHELTNFNSESNGWKPPRGGLHGLPSRDDLPLSVGVVIDHDSGRGAAKNGGGPEFSKEKKLDGQQVPLGADNGKDAEREEEKSCLVDCLYYTLQCCDCSIM